MKWEITFKNGYCGCDNTEEFEGTYEEAVDFAESCLADYAESYSYAALDWDNEYDYDSEEYQEYLADCSYYIEEMEVDE